MWRGLSDCICLSVYLSVCWLVTFVSPAKTVELIDMPFGGADSDGPKEPRIRLGRGNCGGYQTF